jgi:hypothetical protein
MVQTTLLINTLKKALKAHGKTYADVARQLQLTQASVKRLFSEKSFSLQRLDQVCQLIGMEISDLVQMMNEGAQRKITQLREEQEQEIVSDLELLLITFCVLNRWSFEEITNYYNIPELRCIQKLAKLDRLKIIELLPKNRVKLLAAADFSWRENGPIQRFFQEKVEADFFRSRFDKDTEQLVVINGMLSQSSNVVFQRKMERLAREFNELNNDDAGLPLDQRHGTTVVLAIRQWKYGLFEQFVRK